MLYAQSTTGRAVLRLVLDRLSPLHSRGLAHSATPRARASEEAHHQQILHDRRQRRAIQEDVAQSSSRGEIDRLDIGPKLPVGKSAFKNVAMGGGNSPWKDSPAKAGKGTMRRYDDKRSPQRWKIGTRSKAAVGTSDGRVVDPNGAAGRSQRHFHSSHPNAGKAQYKPQAARKNSGGGSWIHENENTSSGPRRADGWSVLKEDVVVAEEEAPEAEVEGLPSEDSDISELREEESSSSVEKGATFQTVFKGKLSASDVKIEDVDPLRPMKIAKLNSFYSRVLFSPGVHPLQDQRTGVWNFPAKMAKIPQPDEIAFDRLPGYISPSQDDELNRLAKREGCRFVGSTSTLTKALSHMYFALSGGKGVELSSFSQEFASERSGFTAGAELPAAIILTRSKDGVVAVDSDKSFDVENVLSEFGHILEKMLTTTAMTQYFAKYPENKAVQAEMKEKEAYKYRKSGSMLMRSQLDCHDPRLPGSGVFDIKTRAVFPIRHDRSNYAKNSAYYIGEQKGLKGSFEKELYDLLRAGMLKFSMQVRIGGMDGIFLAYHNTKTLLGFQYLPLDDIDNMLFGAPAMGEESFHLSVGLLEKVLEQIMQDHPSSDRLEVVIRNTIGRVLIFVTPSPRPEPAKSSESSKSKTTMYSLQVRSTLNGREINGVFDWPIKTENAPEWNLSYTLSRSSSDPASAQEASAGLAKALKYITGMNTLSVPHGSTVEEMYFRDRTRIVEARAEARASATPSSDSPGQSAPKGEKSSESSQTGQLEKVAQVRWKEPDDRVRKIREEAAESGSEYEKRKNRWKKHRNMCSWIPLQL